MFTVDVKQQCNNNNFELLAIKVYPHVKASGQSDFSFENESTCTMCTVIAVMIGNYGCMKAVTSKNGWPILQNSY